MVRNKITPLTERDFGKRYRERLDLCTNPRASLKFTFTHSPLLDKIHVAELNSELGQYMRPVISTNPRYDWTLTMLKDLIWRALFTKNFIVRADGETGSGKDSIADFLALFALLKSIENLGDKIEKEHGRLPKFDISYVAFARDEMARKLKDTIPCETIVMSEDIPEYVGEGSRRSESEVQIVEQTLRGDILNLIWCAPQKFQHPSHFDLRAYDIDYEHGINRSILYKDCQGIPVPYARILTPWSEVHGYQKKKKKYMRAVKDFETKTKTDRIKVLCEKTIEYIEKDKGLDIIGLKKGDLSDLAKEYTHDRFTGAEYDRIVRTIQRDFIEKKLPKLPKGTDLIG